MKDSINSLKLGFHYLLPVLDERGRAIIYNDISLLPLETDPGGLMDSYEVSVSLHKKCLCILIRNSTHNQFFTFPNQLVSLITNL